MVPIFTYLVINMLYIKSKNRIQLTIDNNSFLNLLTYCDQCKELKVRKEMKICDKHVYKK